MKGEDDEKFMFKVYHKLLQKVNLYSAGGPIGGLHILVYPKIFKKIECGWQLLDIYIDFCQ